MPLYRVTLITSTGELVQRSHHAPTAQECLDYAAEQFLMSNDDHGELDEVIVEPP